MPLYWNLSVFHWLGWGCRFGRKITGRALFHHSWKSFIHQHDLSILVGTLITWLRSCLLCFFAAKSQIPVLYSTHWKEVPTYSPLLKSGESCCTFRMGWSVYRDLGRFLLQLTQIFSEYKRVHICFILWIIIQWGFINCYSSYFSFSHCKLSVGSCIPLQYSHHWKLWDNFLPVGTTRCSRLILSVSCTIVTVSHFSKQP